MKVSFNKDEEIVKTIKEGLERTGVTVHAGWRELRPINAYAVNSEIK